MKRLWRLMGTILSVIIVHMLWKRLFKKLNNWNILHSGRMPIRTQFAWNERRFIKSSILRMKHIHRHLSKTSHNSESDKFSHFSNKSSFTRNRSLCFNESQAREERLQKQFHESDRFYVKFASTVFSISLHFVFQVALDA